MKTAKELLIEKGIIHLLGHQGDDEVTFVASWEIVEAM